MEFFNAPFPAQPNTHEPDHLAAFYRILSENIRLGVSLIDSDCTILACNMAHARNFNKTPAEMIGEKCFAEHEKEDEPCAVCPGRDALASKLESCSEKAGVRDDGSRFFARLHCYPLIDEDGVARKFIQIVEDITEMMSVKECLHQSEESFRTIFEYAGIGMLTANLKMELIDFNQAFCSMLGYTAEELKSLTILDITHPDDLEVTEQHFQDVRKGLRPVYQFDKRFLRKDGQPVWVTANVVWLFKNGQPTFGFGMLQDIRQRKKVEAELRESHDRLYYLAHHDLLTHLPNRILLMDRLEHAMEKARRSRKKVVLLYLDLDRFKNINDSFGHSTGDGFLCMVADRLRSAVRKEDTLARLGGDEFVVVLEQIGKLREVHLVAQAILSALALPFLVEGEEYFVSASMGIVLFPVDAHDAEDLLKRAEAAMYRAKKEGGGRFQFYTPKINGRSHEMLAMESRLRHALEENQLVLHYQPQFDLFSDRIIGVEALLRWEDPNHGLVSPGDFIPMAEETGLIVPIGDWVLREVCTQGKAWQDAGYPKMRLAINVSARQFRQETLVKTFSRLLKDTGLSPEWLEVEITESTIMENVERAIYQMQELSQMGVGIVIDDFGTGYSSLSYLSRFPITKLKIDRSFVINIRSDKDAAIATAIIGLAKNLDIEVVAEGIETREQLNLLIRRGCGKGQGFLFSRPLPVTEFTQLLARDKKERMRGGNILSPAFT